MSRQSSWLAEIRTALTMRPVAVAADPRACALVLRHLIALRRREAKQSLDPLGAAAIEADAERLEKLLGLVRRGLPARRRTALPIPRHATKGAES